MPAKRKKEQVEGQYFKWLLGRRNGTYYADGRSNAVDAGRHSLATHDRSEALESLKRLDLHQAVAHGMADRSLLDDQPAPLTLEDGRRLYEEEIGRARITGGLRASSKKRYRAVLDKFLPFAQARRVQTWNQVTAQLLGQYANYLDSEQKADATLYFELNTIKSVVNWLTRSGHLFGAKPIVFVVKKPVGTTTYCWRLEQVTAMVSHCRSHAELAWLAAVIVGLACTGLRISELASLRWADIDNVANLIRLTDESRRSRRRSRPGRETKTGCSRSVPIFEELKLVLDSLERQPDGFVFHGPRGGRLKPDTVRLLLIRDVLQPLKERFPALEGAPGFADGRLHSFRHYFCSVCVIKHVPEQMVMNWLGHSDSKMVRHYFHLRDEDAQQQMKRLDFLGSGLGGVAGPGGKSE
jgi:integrase